MSYGTGSVGLNLQFANYVFLFDRWWNPAVEDQAINRAHRLGQKAPVFVSRFICAETIEKRIADVLDKKRELFNEMIEANGPPASLGLTADEVVGLFDVSGRLEGGRGQVADGCIGDGSAISPTRTAGPLQIA